jgi:ubiquinone/menaquinone biosynthesis C-methylase UbiE
VIKFYDHLGTAQDRSGYYEHATLADLIRHAAFNKAYSLVEFGCGTGRFAEDLLKHHLPHPAVYWGCDVSDTMIELSQERLSPFGRRVTLWKSPGGTSLPLEDESSDRFVSNYVLDILSHGEIRAVITEARRVLEPAGLLCLAGLTHGKGFFSKLWTAFWNVRFGLNPKWVGGCRPLAILGFLGEWDVLHRNVVVARGISSEVVVARKR